MTTAPEQPSTGQRPAAPRWMRIALVLSLAANLLVAGVILGAVIGRDGSRAAVRSARDLGPMPFVAALDHEERHRLGLALRAAVPEHVPDRRAMRDRLRRLLDALRAEAFDADALIALLDEARTGAMARQEAGARLLADHLAALTPAERRAYADRLERALRRGFRR